MRHRRSGPFAAAPARCDQRHDARRARPARHADRDRRVSNPRRSVDARRRTTPASRRRTPRRSASARHSSAMASAAAGSATISIRSSRRSGSLRRRDGSVTRLTRFAGGAVRRAGRRHRRPSAPCSRPRAWRVTSSRPSAWRSLPSGSAEYETRGVEAGVARGPLGVGRVPGERIGEGRHALARQALERLTALDHLAQATPRTSTCERSGWLTVCAPISSPARASSRDSVLVDDPQARLGARPRVAACRASRSARRRSRVTPSSASSGRAIVRRFSRPSSKRDRDQTQARGRRPPRSTKLAHRDELEARLDQQADLGSKAVRVDAEPLGIVGRGDNRSTPW